MRARPENSSLALRQGKSVNGRALTGTVTLYALLFSILITGCAPNRQVADFPSPYQRPLNSPGGKFSALPPAVQNTIRAEAGASEILDIVRSSQNGLLFYKVYFVNSKILPPLYVAADGSVLNPNMTVAMGAAYDSIGIASGGASSLKASDLPPNVMRLIQERAPHSEIAYIQKEKWGDREVYLVSFKDPNHNPDLSIAADGTILKGRP